MSAILTTVAVLTIVAIHPVAIIAIVKVDTAVVAKDVMVSS